jgi:hypothetical protein
MTMPALTPPSLAPIAGRAVDPGAWTSCRPDPWRTTMVTPFPATTACPSIQSWPSSMK